jgi:hypothetical protein
MKTKIIGISEGLSHFSLGQEINASIKYLENNMHELMIDEKKHIIEITKTIFSNNTTLIIEGFITDNTNVGKVGIEIKY